MPGSRRILRHGRAADPWRWCAALTLAFAALTFWRLGIPSKIYFDELYYVPAARALLHMRRANPEHPMVAKLAIALAIRLFGDHPAAWRLPSALMGTVGLWAFSRALCLASGRRVATVVGTLLLACNFAWFVQSRVAMLDMVMAGFAMVMLWQVLAAVRLPAGHAGRARLHLLAAGVAMGLSLGAKWSVLPVIVLVPLALAAVRVAVAGPRALTRSNAPPMQGISLAELALWLGLLPLAVYVASFTPIALWRDNTVPLTHIVAWHRYMVQLQASVIKHHPYQSVWWQWVIDWRPIWFLYENVDGAQRGILLLGNPFAMLAGLPAMVWCLWRGVATFGARHWRWDAGGAALLWIATVGMWAIDGKPVQFYYHYLLPGAFLMACLALALDAWWSEARRWGRMAPLRWLAPGAVALSVALFAWFFPILAALPLGGPHAFATWMWLNSWR